MLPDPSLTLHAYCICYGTSTGMPAHHNDSFVCLPSEFDQGRKTVQGMVSAGTDAQDVLVLRWVSKTELQYN